MSLSPTPINDVPELTAQVARAAFPNGNRYMQMRDTLGTIYADVQFADLYPPVGQPAEAPWRLALVTIMQFAENLTDRQAAEAVRGRLDWKYALGLELTDAGFDFSALSEFRSRLIAGAAEERLLTQLLAHFVERGLLKARGKQRTDSTHIVAAVRELNRLEIVGETLHHALNVLVQLAPDWLRDHVTTAWFLRYGQRFSAYRLPKGTSDRHQLAETIGRDGSHLLTRVYRADAPPHLRPVPAVEMLRQVWVQQYYQENSVVHWRDAKNFPPSSVDTIHHALADQALLPTVHVVDGAYVSSDGLVASQQAYQVALTGPMRQDQSWQAHDNQAFDTSQFVIDWHHEVATGPNGKQSRYWKLATGPRGKPTIQVLFHKKDCAGCAMRTRCTRSKTGPRELTLHPQAQQLALQAARQRQQTDDFTALYKSRAGVEGTISQAVFALGMRRTRYRGLVKTHLQHIATATAMNLQRFVDWLWEVPRSRTYKSPFMRLAPAT